jgi:hypothetical protein
MKSMIIKTEIQIAGGSEFRFQEGHGGCVELTETVRQSVSNPRMSTEKVVVRIPAFSGESANIATGNLDFLHFSSGNLNVVGMSLRK